MMSATKIWIPAIAIGLVGSFVAGRMTSESLPADTRPANSTTIEPQAPVAAESVPQLIAAYEQAPNASPTRRSNTDPQSSRDFDTRLASDDPSSQLNALWNLWVMAADSGVPSEALHALESIRDAPGVDARVQREADLALEDLARLIGSREAATHSPAREDEPPDSFDREYAMAEADGSESDAIGFEQFAVHLDDPKPRVRLDAVRALARHRREEIPQLLLRAVHDSDTGVRLETVRSLWYVAADGFDRDGEILRSLEYASRDRDDRVRTLAEQALRDLASFASY